MFVFKYWQKESCNYRYKHFKALTLSNFELEGQGQGPGTIMEMTSPQTEILGLPSSVKKVFKKPFFKIMTQALC